LYQLGRTDEVRTVNRREATLRRFHIAIAVADLAASIEDYRHRLGVPPTAVVPGKYALFRTKQLNFSINEMPARAGQLRHLGFEDDAARDFSSDHDVNGIEWELFSPAAQDAKIPEVYGSNVVWGDAKV
jgi:catechol 2,3-dioxygenase-like lactoylglutathione lyase family enzyme